MRKVIDYHPFEYEDHTLNVLLEHLDNEHFCLESVFQLFQFLILKIVNDIPNGHESTVLFASVFEALWLIV